MFKKVIRIEEVDKRTRLHYQNWILSSPTHSESNIWTLRHNTEGQSLNFSPSELFSLLHLLEDFFKDHLQAWGRN